MDNEVFVLSQRSIARNLYLKAKSACKIVSRKFKKIALPNH